MGKVIQFHKTVRAELGVAQPRPRKRKKAAKTEYVGINVHIDPEPNHRLRVVKRQVLHGILASWDWNLTTGLFLTIFERGGVFRVRCPASDIAEIREQIELRLPDLVVRRVRAA